MSIRERKMEKRHCKKVWVLNHSTLSFYSIFTTSSISFLLSIPIPLQKATEKNRDKILSLLVAHGADVNAAHGNENRTALHLGFVSFCFVDFLLFFLYHFLFRFHYLNIAARNGMFKIKMA